jgi:hypothetical protein
MVAETDIVRNPLAALVEQSAIAFVILGISFVYEISCDQKQVRFLCIAQRGLQYSAQPGAVIHDTGGVKTARSVWNCFCKMGIR